jgi:hypothetical protein
MQARLEARRIDCSRFLEKHELLTQLEELGGSSAACCSICCDDFVAGDPIRVLPCQHRFREYMQSPRARARPRGLRRERTTSLFMHSLDQHSAPSCARLCAPQTLNVWTNGCCQPPTTRGHLLVRCVMRRWCVRHRSRSRRTPVNECSHDSRCALKRIVACTIVLTACTSK